ncbi:hypothetical protein P4V88_27450 [Bacillus thuringiensis]|uniref:hypothetical protein n=1 Tax=Bacillus thuringiensis TaxID=1428 RepID=UPI000A36F882|nr:hypothetical protein [Bacillus thuringiensis]MED2128924.1 hypothetical protein [Bacillus thuringiensis]MED2148662.1 hypothetical protein [Bacillus thuringiensis]MED2175630.1 hypothetical protein [Bacillus thuringiensis]MED2478073.1 hypothetical protein [Bacillus thuringiensis]MED2575281.1 hypothetical protein [Bacillus thuringiensis]
MFLLGNISLILIFTVFVFILFTYLNVCGFSRRKGVTTSIFLTFTFLGAFIKLPFVATQFLYKEREKPIRAIKKSKKLTEEQKEEMISIFQNRRKIFIALYKTGHFSYTEQLINFSEWYQKKPFKVTVEVRLVTQKKKYEQTYLRDIKKEFAGLCTTS